ncbi:hypothetical protein DH2020_000291 [Rehmannia glutinosa]|uniref:Nonsense-mediated mRNA decay factor SMG8 n=1 Tax=Rehmannia glutinosa TaxID=99300 RepID=A0ABR0XW80_REHGL
MGTHSQSVRVLVRPPPVPAPAPSLPPQPPPPPPPDPYSHPKNGVVCVGFIGRRHHDVAYLINKIVDSHVFGSGNLDTPFRVEPDKMNPEISKWFASRNLSFYHDEDQAILYLQFSSVCCPVTDEGSSETRFGFESVFEDQEFGDLQGLMFMFSLLKACLRRKAHKALACAPHNLSVLQFTQVCHIIILIQEGSRFDTQMLKKFRILQAAKHTMAPFVRSQNTPPANSRARSSTHSRVSIPGASPKNPSLGKSRGILNRNASAITVGSYTSLLPGQCTPVVLFVFLDDFNEIHPSGNMEEPSETSSLHSSSRAGLPTKGSGSVPCWVEEWGAITGSSPLFSLDASKAVSLVDACSCQSGESLEFAIGLVDELILHGILSAKRARTYETETNRMHEQDAVLPPGENEATSSDSFESAVSHLDSGVGLNTRFSTMWCQKAFPVAKEVYLDNLPPCYPSSQHEDHLTKALCVLTSMVKGPAVQLYMKKLKDECTSIWISGRQLCDERIRPDPFDYETANVTYNTFADCDKFLPAVQLPEGSIEGPIRPSSWNLIRVGGARYYDPSKGLLQSGFCTTQKFLLKWTILLEKLKEVNHSLLNESQKVSSDRNINVETVVDSDSQASDAAWLGSGRTQNGVGIKVSLSSYIIGNSSNNGSVGRGKQPIPDAEKGVMLHHARNRGLDKQGETVENQESRIAVVDKTLNNGIAGDIGDPFPHISSKVVPLNMNDSEQTKAASSMKHVTIYVGFEHECPHGHRFILTQDHLSELGSAYSVPEDNIVPLSVENSDKKPDPTKLGKSGGHGRSRRQSNGLIMGGGNGKAKNLEKSKEKLANGNMYSNKSMKSTRQGRDQNERTKVTDFVKDLDSDAKSTTVDDGGCAFSLLKRSLPIYMSCPHCRDSSTKNDASNVKFASTISQLQRIFVVTPSFPILLAADPIIQFEVCDSVSCHLELLIASITAFCNFIGTGRCSCLFSEFEMSGIELNLHAHHVLSLSFLSFLSLLFNCGRIYSIVARNYGNNLECFRAIRTFSVLTQSYTGFKSHMLCLCLMVDKDLCKLSCLPPSIPDRERKLQFSLGCPVILPPESFLSLRLPFVYGVELEDGSLHSLKPLKINHN